MSSLESETAAKKDALEDAEDWGSVESERERDPEPLGRSNVMSGTFEINRWETDGGSLVVDEPAPLVGGTASERAREESPQRLVGATCNPHARPDA